jgi:hypothetical protein
MIAVADDDDAPPPPGPGRAKRPGVVRGLRAVLTGREIRILSAYVVDRLPQSVIARRERMRQTTVSARIRAAVRKLARAGIVVPMPARGNPKAPPWRPAKAQIVVLDPADVERLVVTDRTDGVTRGRWVDGDDRHNGTRSAEDAPPRGNRAGRNNRDLDP